MCGAIARRCGSWKRCATPAQRRRIDAAMKRAGFYQDLGGQPGSWLCADEIPVDLMVPEALAGGGSRRSGQIPPHGKHATRRAVGPEAAVVDSSQMDIASLGPTDTRSIPVRVAGPAALMGLEALQDLRAQGPAGSSCREERP